MTIKRWFPILSSAALLLVCFSADRGQAGSFFGPCCYGASYTEEYPNRSHNTFGCGPGTHCTARHPIFKHRWFRKNKGEPVPTSPVCAMPVQGAPVEIMQAPVTQTPLAPSPINIFPAAPPMITPAPATAARITPVPALLPSGPPNPEPPIADQTSKAPF